MDTRLKVKEKIKKITQNKKNTDISAKKKLEKLGKKINTSWISKKTALELLKDGVVLLPINEYQKLASRAVPEYYLTGEAAKNLDKLVKDGLKEYKEGKCEKINSLADLD